MSADVVAPVRRSALHGIHERLGARWIGSGVAWPESYASAGSEMEATRTGVALAELGPVDKLMLRGSGTTEALADMGVSPREWTVTQVGDLDTWLLGADEALVLLDTTIVGAGSLDVVAGRARATAATAIDVSSGTTVLRLVGPRARRVLEAFVPVDVSDTGLPKAKVVAAPLAGVRVTIGRIDLDHAPGFTLLVERDAAAYLWSALLEVGAGHGIVPVGGGVARPPRPTSVSPEAAS